MSKLAQVKEFVVINNALRGTLLEGVFYLDPNMFSGSAPTVTNAALKKFDISDNVYVGKSAR